MTTKLRFTADPGHGWLHVKRALAKRIMGADFVRLSQCSFQRGSTLYLEEDCDATLFLNCATAAGLDYTVEIHSTDKRSPIRSYDRLVHYTYS